jgi:hypothetical protein
MVRSCADYAAGIIGVGTGGEPILQNGCKMVTLEPS